MKFTYNLLATSLIIAMPVAANAAANKMIDDITFYGKAEIQLNHTDTGLMRYVKEGSNINSPYSRIGIKGTHQLNDKFSAVFKFEYQVKGMDDDVDTLTARNTYIGIKGNFGEVVFGRNDTRFKKSEANFDLFNETADDISQVLAGQDRLGDSITYSAPRLGQFNLAFTATIKDDTGFDKNGYAWLVTTGDKSLKKSPYYVAYAGTQDLNNLDLHRIVANYRIKHLVLGAMIQQSQTSDGLKDGDGFMLNAGYQMGQWLAKVQYASDDSKIRHAEEVEQLSVGLDYIFDSQAKAYILLSALDLETNDDNTIGLGLQYKF
ncbi:MAG: porin [Gammaproteobacteria bacterium]|nr:porin [Gammaproteobacteria bacterium]